MNLVETMKEARTILNRGGRHIERCRSGSSKDARWSDITSEKLCPPVNPMPRVSQGDQYIAQMQLVQHQPLPDGLAQYPRIDMARIPCLVSRQFVDCRPDQRVRVTVGECHGPPRPLAVRRLLQRHDQIDRDNALRP